MHVAVDVQKCVASGLCVLTSPEIFDQTDDDGLVSLLDETPDPARHREVREAATLCPAAAITLREP